MQEYRISKALISTVILEAIKMVRVLFVCHGKIGRKSVNYDTKRFAGMSLSLTPLFDTFLILKVTGQDGYEVLVFW